MRKVTVLLADDNPDILSIIQEMLTPTFDVVALARDGESLISAALEHRPDVIITDISMPGLTGIDAAIEILKHEPRSRILMLTVNRDRMLAARALAIGALGYVLKLSAGEELNFAILEALEGRTFVSPALNLDGSKDSYSGLSLSRDHVATANKI